MQKRSYPSRKNYIYELPTIYGTVILQFQQATSNEARNEYNNSKNMDVETFLGWYVNKMKSRVLEYKKPRYVPTFMVWNAIKSDFAKILKEITALRVVKRKSLYENHIEAKPDKYRKPGLNNIDGFLAKKCNVGIQEVRDILTDEQIGFILDDARREYYESFKQGKSVNDKILQENGRQLSDKEKDLLKYMKEQKERVAKAKADLLQNK